MAIFVVCPGCRTRFTVSEKFAGRSGPCPKCKTTIQIPKLDEQVVIHEPEQFDRGGRGVSGELTLKPIARVERRLNLVTLLAAVGCVLVVFVTTSVLGHLHVWENRLWLQAIGLFVVAVPAAGVGYEILRNQDDLKPFRGRELILRSAGCGLAYVLVWWIFNWSVSQFITEELWTWLIVLPPIFALGGFVAYAAMELEYSISILHFTFFALIALVLRWAAGLGWIWVVPQPPMPF